MKNCSKILLRANTGFSLVELMVGLTIGFIAVAVILQSLSAFDANKRTTTAGVDAQENGLLALMSIEAEIRKAAVGFNHPAALSCQNFYSYYQETSGTGTPTTVGAMPTLPVLITQGGRADTISIQNGMRITGAAPAKISNTVVLPISPATPDHIEVSVERFYDLNGVPVNAGDPPADLVLLVNVDKGHCALMGVSSRTGNKLTIQNGPDGKANEYNAPISYMTANNWPGFGTLATEGFYEGSLAFRVGSVQVGGLRSISYSVDANNSLVATTTVTGAVEATPPVIASEIVALKAQYGVSDTPADKEITSWENPSGTTWGNSALTAAGATDARQRIKAIRIAVIARSNQRDGALVSQPCKNESGTILHYGPCAWPGGGPAIPLGSASDTEWQRYRYKVYQTVIPMRNILWPEL